MRRTLAAITVTIGLATIGTLTACEPTMKLTATTAAKPGCGSITWVEGTVSPADATTKVWLQKTVGGKWVDWKWTTGNTGESLHRLSDNVEQGTYKIVFQAPYRKGVLHLRVRSDSGAGLSNSVYPSPTAYDDGQCYLG